MRDQTIWLSGTSAFQAEETANTGTKRQGMFGMFYKQRKGQCEKSMVSKKEMDKKSREKRGSTRSGRNMIRTWSLMLSDLQIKRDNLEWRTECRESKNGSRASS